MKRILLFPDATPGGAPSEVVGTTPGDLPNPPDPPAPTPSAPAAEPPPAARIVVAAEVTEREINLQAELDAEKARHAVTADEKKKREVRIAELEDERRTLLQPPPPKAKKSKPFLPTLLHPTDDDAEEREE